MVEGNRSRVQDNISRVGKKYRWSEKMSWVEKYHENTLQFGILFNRPKNFFPELQPYRPPKFDSNFHSTLESNLLKRSTHCHSRHSIAYFQLYCQFVILFMSLNICIVHAHLKGVAE
jgi:hypothetical protein